MDNLDLSQAASEPFSQLVSGLAVERLHSGQAVIFTLHSNTRKTIDVWIEACLAEMKACVEAGRLLRVVQDLSDPNMGQTPYSRERGAAVTAAYPELRGYIAFVLMKTIEAERVKTFVRSQKNEYRERDVFWTREAALKWVTRDLDK